MTEFDDNDFQREREIASDRVTQLLEDTGSMLNRLGLARGAVIRSRDVHAYYKLEGSNRAVYIQGYPGFSLGDTAAVYAKLVDYHKLHEIMESGTTPLGNEHAATVHEFSNFPTIRNIPYEPEVLVQELQIGLAEVS